LLHGRFDAVCSPRNVRHLLALQSQGGHGDAQARLCAGHLAFEPAIAQGLRELVNRDGMD
jgi:hypothetical protein